MRLTVGRKIVAGLAVILVIGTLSMAIIYRGLGAVRDSLRDLAERREPSSAAAYEMEINANGIGFSVLNYLGSSDPRYRELVRADRADFGRFHARYLRLSASREERVLGDSIGRLFRGFEALADELMDDKDRQDRLFTGVTRSFEDMDEVIDRRLQPGLDNRDAGAIERRVAVNDLEADVAEVAFSLANYQRTHRPEAERLLLENEAEFSALLASFQRLPLTPGERAWASELGRLFDETIVSVGEILALEDELRGRSQRFIETRTRIDRLLDEEIQVRELAELVQPRRRADREAALVIATLQVLIPLFVIAAVGVGVLLTRGVLRPIRRLERGAEAVGRGELSHRIEPAGRDELADLARRFNEMVARLEATTVSRDLLEESQREIQRTVVELRREIAERIRAQEEQARLEASLRRSETMAAMGSLVAGVAHEVRNPLFGLSSILDAMNERFGTTADYPRYADVMRRQVERLNRLMRDLLQYGSPPSPDLAPGSVAEVVEAAVRDVATFAESGGVRLSAACANGLPRVRMDRDRLLQVFANLLENAVQHSPAGGTVRVEMADIRRDGRRLVECSVEDSGPGVTEEDLQRIFEPFFTRRPGGTGLGLSIVQRIVEEHGGEVAVANRTRGGAVVTVTLPATG